MKAASLIHKSLHYTVGTVYSIPLVISLHRCRSIASLPPTCNLVVYSDTLRRAGTYVVNANTYIQCTISCLDVHVCMVYFSIYKKQLFAS